MKSLKNKFWKKAVLGIMILSIFIAPVSANLSIKKIAAQTNSGNEFTGANSGEGMLVKTSDIKDTQATITITITNTIDESYQNLDIYLNNSDTGEVINPTPVTVFPSAQVATNQTTQDRQLKFYNLKPNTNYLTNIYLTNLSWAGLGGIDSKILLWVSFKTGDKDQAGAVNSTGGSSYQNSDLDVGCNANPLTWFTKCPVLFLYNIIFEPISWLTEQAAKFMDFFIFYSINGNSYSSSFVEKAWSVVRDVSNMLFIVALLYVGIKTILGMNVSNNKRIIGMIVIIALLVNFSLFVSKVVIDASNILAHVFYNNITPYDANGAVQSDKNKPKSVSVGLVRNFDPQAVIATPKDNLGSFAVVTIIFIALMVYMIIMFISVAMFFVGRVAGLWMAMIFSPLAFVSHAMPFPIPEFGFQKWLSSLMKLAFMAPIFAFFLYVIILFGNFLGEIQYDIGNSTNWLDKLMKTIIPFVLIFILLRQAKKLAKDYSGEMGEAFSKAGAAVGGLALGAAAGGAAIFGTRVVGKYAANRVSGAAGERLRERATKKGVSGWVAKQQLKALNYGSKANYDLRQSKLGEQINKQGLNTNTASYVGLGVQKGGYQGIIDRKADKLEKEKELYKTQMSDAQVQAWSREERARYAKGLEDAKKPGGIGEAAYKQQHGAEMPKEYSNASELNADRMQNFKDKLGFTDLIGSMAYEFSKKNLVNKDNYKVSKDYEAAYRAEREKDYRIKLANSGEAFTKEGFDEYISEQGGIKYNNDIASEVNNKLINDRRMSVGAATGGALGVLAGGAGGGFPGSVIGAGLSGRSSADEAAAAKVAGSITKELKGAKVNEERITKAEDAIREYGKMVEKQIATGNIQTNDGGKTYTINEYIKIDGKNVLKDANGQIKGIKADDDGNIDLGAISSIKIDKEKVDDEIAGVSFDIDKLRLDLQRYVKEQAEGSTRTSAEIDDDIDSVREKMKAASKKMSELNTMRSAEAQILSNQKEIENIKGKASSASDKDKK